MSIQFTKMQGLGNDFVVFDTVRQSVAITEELIRSMADRHRGIGCDQVLVLTPANHPHADFGYRIFNADGNEVYQCGNGARCMGLFIQQEKLSDKKIIYLETQCDLMRVQCLSDNQVQVDIGKPRFDAESLPFITTENSAPYHLQLEGHAIEFDVVSVGNPHCVIRVDKILNGDVIDIGEQLNAHPAFPEGVNVGFLRCESHDLIHLSVYERGAGLTQACGSGACAAVAVGQKNGYLNAAVLVHQSGGILQVSATSKEAVIQLTGPANRVFQGVW